LHIFQKLADAEAQVHAVPSENVHFHEVGATDSILDIVGAAVGLDYFAIEQVYCGALPYSSGQVNSQHGAIPLPAPATLALLTQARAALRPVEVTAELVTPTGAAIVAAFARFEQPAMRLAAAGSGAGQKELPWPNILRVLMGESSAPAENENAQHSVLETHIDDMNPQFYGALMDSLFAAGALDVAYVPIYMKKNRPGTRVTVIAPLAEQARLAGLLLRESTTFGVRAYPVQRYEANRDFITLQLPLGSIRLKRKWLDSVLVQSVPEYEDCRRLAEQHNLPLQDIYNLIRENLAN